MPWLKVLPAEDVNGNPASPLGAHAIGDEFVCKNPEAAADHVKAGRCEYLHGEPVPRWSDDPPEAKPTPKPAAKRKPKAKKEG